MKMKKRILYFTDAVESGGAEVFLKMLLEKADLKRYEVVLAIPKRRETASLVRTLRAGGVDVRHFQKIGRMPLWSLAGSYRIFHKVRPDIVHFNLQWPPASLYPLCLAVRMGYECFATEHLVPEYYRPGVLEQRCKRFAYRKIRKVFCVSEESKRLLMNKYRVEGRNIQVVYNGVDGSRFTDLDESRINTLRHSYNPQKNRVIVATIGRLHYQKGHAYLIEAAKNVLRNYPNTLFVFVGEGPERRNIEGLIEKHQLGQHIILIGQRSDIPEILGLSDLFVLPSLFEGFPISILEAMASGVPVIATDVGGVKEQVIQGHTGYVVPAENASALEEALVRLLSNESLRHEMGEKGREMARKLFSTDRMVQKIFQAYEEAR